MDLGTMRKSAWAGKYKSVKDLESDFFLMISNCLRFNPKEGYFYKIALKVRKCGNQILMRAKEVEQKVKYNVESGAHPDEQITLDNVAKFGFSPVDQSTNNKSSAKSKSRKKEPSESDSVELGCSTSNLLTPAGNKLVKSTKKSAEQKGKQKAGEKTPANPKTPVVSSTSRKRSGSKAGANNDPADAKRKKGNLTESLFGTQLLQLSC